MSAFIYLLGGGSGNWSSIFNWEQEAHCCYLVFIVHWISSQPSISSLISQSGNNLLFLSEPENKAMLPVSLDFVFLLTFLSPECGSCWIHPPPPHPSSCRNTLLFLVVFEKAPPLVEKGFRERKSQLIQKESKEKTGQVLLVVYLAVWE